LKLGCGCNEWRGGDSHCCDCQDSGPMAPNTLMLFNGRVAGTTPHALKPQVCASDGLIITAVYSSDGAGEQTLTTSRSALAQGVSAVPYRCFSSATVSSLVGSQMLRSLMLESAAVFRSSSRSLSVDPLQNTVIQGHYYPLGLDTGCFVARQGREESETGGQLPRPLVAGHLSEKPSRRTWSLE
jgi:hypothetical protein